MSKVKITGHASGSGTLTLTGPNTNSDRTLTLPDNTGTLLTTEGAVTINDSGADVDFRVEGSGAANALFVQGSDGNVGIGINTPSEELHVSSSEHTKILLDSSIGASKAAQLHFKNDANTYSAGVGTNDNFTIYDETAAATRLMIDTSGAVTMPHQPAFLAKMSTSQTNIAINGLVKILFDTEIFDQNADFDTSTNTFTAPVTGKYFLAMNLVFDNVDTAAGFYQFHILTSNRGYTQTNHSIFASDPSYWTFNYSAIADMDAGDTAYVNYYQNVGTAQVDTRAGTETTFSGALIA